MRRIVHSRLRRKVLTFLNRISNTKMEWLERIDPGFLWILRHIYGPLSCTVEELVKRSDWSDATINSKRDQALYLLGMKLPIRRLPKRAADNRLAEFQIRQRLTYLRDNGDLGPGDREVVSLALQFGSCPSDIARQSDWTVQTLFHALGRLAGVKELHAVRPGDRIRQAAFQELLKTGENPKAALELKLFSALDEETAIVDLASEWGCEPTVLSAIAAEARRELSLHPSTRSRFSKLNRKKEGSGVARGSLAIQHLNAQLLPLYKVFRGSARPFSASERKYLRLRAKGTEIAVAGRKALGVNPWRAMAIDRALLGYILPLRFEFAETLPLPPFTNAQHELIERLNYARV